MVALHQEVERQRDGYILLPSKVALGIGPHGWSDSQKHSIFLVCLSACLSVMNENAYHTVA